MTAVRVFVNRRDLWRFHVHTQATHKSTWMSWIACAFAIAALEVVDRGLETLIQEWSTSLPAIFIRATLVWAALMAMCLMLILCAVSQSKAVLGEHMYMIREDGLVESTIANETLIRWGGAKSLKRTPAFILVEVLPWMVHVIPRRSFENESEYEAFWRALAPLVPRDA